MSRIDSVKYANRSATERFVCTRCFRDEDLSARIRASGKPGICSYCDRSVQYSVALSEIAEFIETESAHSMELPSISYPMTRGEGGYQGLNWDTQELLFDEIGLTIAAKVDNRLMYDLLGEIEDEVWAEYDCTALALDDSLVNSWQEFRRITMGKRRFFFHSMGGNGPYSHPDDRSVGAFLAEVAERIVSLRLVRTIKPGSSLFRVREQTDPPFVPSAVTLGPPPSQFCLQSNRMNPPGIPMFYGAQDQHTAIVEARASRPVIGRFETIEPLRIIDLANLPRIPGFFSEASREVRQGLSFFHHLSRAIAAPVDRNDRVNVDYIPTQIITEFLRDHLILGRRPHGIRYVSAVKGGAANVVLFTEPENVADQPGEDVWLVLRQTQEPEDD